MGVKRKLTCIIHYTTSFFFKFSNNEANMISLMIFSALKMFKKTGEIFVQKPGEDVPKVFTFDSVYDWNSEQ